MKNYRQSQFDNLEKKHANKSLFNLSHEIKTQMCFGRYYPILVEECLPGDEWEIDGEYMFRFPSLYFPIQQIGTMRADWFYVPMKLLFPGDSTINYQKTGWQGFIMGEDIELPVTFLNINGAGWGGSSAQQIYPGCSYPIENYMGFPMDTTGRVDGDKQRHILGNAFPLAMYLMCYDEYYRNPLWEEPQFFQLTEGNTNENKFGAVNQTVDGYLAVSWSDTLSNNVKNHAPFFSHYEKDYFTSARPEPQDGDAIQIPMVLEEDMPPTIWKDWTTGLPAADGDLQVNSSHPEGAGGTATGGQFVGLDIQTPAANIKQLRIAQVLQQFHERVMRIGKRYRGFIEGLWGNDPEPNAVDIPQLIGSHYGRIQITDAITTAETGGAETGNYRGNINFHNNGTSHRYYCQDHGLLMCILNVMPNTAYSQGIHPMWTREVDTDYALDMFSGIGDQEIKRKELLALNIDTIWADTDEPYNATIGYQDRFAEYKTRTNRIFNTNELYDSFYMGQIFGGIESDYELLTAGRVIIGASSPINNGIREADIFNALPIKSGTSVYTDSTIYAHMYMTLKVKRALPYFSTPGKMIM